ncbi:MAG: hypothetical protein AAF556_07075, partial [Pseudomonadota bacterium]
MVIVAVGFGFAGVPSVSDAQIESPVQSNAQPLGLDIVGPVNQARSDQDSRRFQRNPYQIIYDNLGLGPTDSNWSGVNNVVSLDPSDLVLVEEYDARVYFVSEASTASNAVIPSADGQLATVMLPGFVESG